MLVFHCTFTTHTGVSSLKLLFTPTIKLQRHLSSLCDSSNSLTAAIIIGDKAINWNCCSLRLFKDRPCGVHMPNVSVLMNIVLATNDIGWWFKTAFRHNECSLYIIYTPIHYDDEKGNYLFIGCWCNAEALREKLSPDHWELFSLPCKCCSSILEV